MAIQGLIDLIFPKVCTSCGVPLYQAEELLCTACRHEIPTCDWTNYSTNLASDKLKGRVQLTYSNALLYFEKGNKTQDLLHDLKYRNQKHISGYLGRWHGQILKHQKWTQDIDMIIPVPIHAKRERQRGYNQVEDYAKAISQTIGCEYNNRILKRRYFSKTQVFKNRLARTDVIDHNFFLDASDNLSGKHLALADDLITTGATAEACFLQLSKLKDVKLSLLVMAVAA